MEKPTTDQESDKIQDYIPLLQNGVQPETLVMTFNHAKQALEAGDPQQKDHKNA